MKQTDDKTITIFWSWQSDSDIISNKNLIFKAIEKATKELKKTESIFVKIDRDTKGIPGSPVIIDTILDKIKKCDIFIWDATICYTKPKYAPNPNVLIEFGYALAVLGESRIIGIMNNSNKLGGDYLPFDLKNRRWPILYSYNKKLQNNYLMNLFRKNNINNIQDKVIENLSREIKIAINLCLESPKGYYSKDNDYLVAKYLYNLIDNSYMRNWFNFSETMAQYTLRKNISDFRNYIDKANRLENKFDGLKLKNLHDLYIKQLESYLYTISKEMDILNEEYYAVSTKVIGYSQEIKNYDKKYSDQVDKVLKAADSLYIAWNEYASALNSYFPEILREKLEIN